MKDAMRCLEDGNVRGVQSKRAFYLVFSTAIATEVRLLGDGSGIGGMWMPVLVNHDEWQGPTMLTVKTWEDSTEFVTAIKCVNRVTLWKEANTKGNLIVDWFRDGEWYASICKPREVC
jgi:hypothetical protein